MAVMSEKGVQYEGLVLETWTGSYQIMSDVWGNARYALIWDAEKQGPKTVVVDVCDYNWCGPNGGYTATIDATPEVFAAYDNWMIERLVADRVWNQQQYNERIENGATVEIVAGRQGKGTVGKVVFTMDGSYGMGYRAVPMKKYCVATSDRKETAFTKNGKKYEKYVDTVWAWARNVKRVDVAPVDEAEVRASVVENYKRTFPMRR